MTHPTPAPALACSLGAPAAAERAARWRRLLDRSLLGRAAMPGGLRFAFRPEPAVAGELRALAAAERECCPFLTLTVEQSGGRLTLDVAAPPDAAEIVEIMFGPPR
jgi:MerR family copper efflux transcriptional regulator